MHLPEMGLNECMEVADAIQKFVEKIPCEYGGTELAMSFSIGLAESYPDGTVDSLLHRVDIKLYEAKNVGRNTITYYKKALIPMWYEGFFVLTRRHSLGLAGSPFDKAVQ